MRAALDLPRTIGSWHPSQRVLRLVLLLSPLVALVAAGPAGNFPAPGIVAIVVGLSVWWAGAPGSGIGSVVLLVVLGWWARVPDDALHPAVLVAAVALLGSHLAAVIAEAAPPRTPVDPAVLRLWLLRGCALLVAPPVLWVLARVLRDDAAPAGLWPAALVGAVLAVVALTVALGRRDGEA